MRASRARAWWRWLSIHSELRPIAALGAAGLLALGFVELADDVREDDTHAVDRAILLALRDPTDPRIPLGPPWLLGAARDVSALGSFAVVLLVAVGVVGYLWVRRRPHAAWVLLAGVVGAAWGSQLLKGLLDRSRPEAALRLTEAAWASFPSGHSMVSAATYLVLGMMLARVHSHRAVRWYLVLASVSIAVLVGLTRVYLGVHWPTDVLGGWALGAAWALVVWTVARWIEERRGRATSRGRALSGAREAAAARGSA